MAIGRAALLACGLVLVGGGAAAAAQAPARLDASVAPRTLIFGDELQVRAEVVVAPDLVDPSSVEIVDTDFRPFEVGEIRRETAQGSELSGVRYVIALHCLAARCLPPEGAGERSFELPPLRVRFEAEDGGGTLEAPLPQVRIETRLTSRDIRDEDAWSYGDRSVPPASYAVAPGVATALLWAVAAGLALLAGVLSVYAATGRTPRRALAARRGTPLERALALARRAASRDAEERRKALERLARELGQAGHRDLSERSGALAWSRPEPSGTAIGALVADVERAIAGAGA